MEIALIIFENAHPNLWWEEEAVVKRDLERILKPLLMKAKTIELAALLSGGVTCISSEAKELVRNAMKATLFTSRKNARKYR